MDVSRLLLERLTAGSDQVPLSNLIEDALSCAKENNITALAEWLNKELYGYGEPNFENTISFIHKHRLTKFDVKNRIGINMRNYFLRSIPAEVTLVIGVIDIEKSIKYNETVEVIFTNAKFWGNADAGDDWADLAYKIKFRPKDLEVTLNKIRIEVIYKLKELIHNNIENPEQNNSEIAMENIKLMIVNDDVEDAIFLITKDNPEIENDTIMLLSKLTEIRKQLRNGTIDQDDYRLEMSRIKIGVIGLLDELKNNKLPNFEGPQGG